MPRDRAGWGADIEMVVREAGLGNLYQGDHDIAIMLRDFGLENLGWQEDYNDVFRLRLEAAGSQGVHSLRYYESIIGGPLIEYRVNVPRISGGDLDMVFRFERDGSIYGNLGTAGHDFRVEANRQQLKLKSQAEGRWQHTLAANDEGKISVPVSVWTEFDSKRLTKVEFGSFSQVGLTVAGDGGLHYRLVLPTNVYGGTQV